MLQAARALGMRQTEIEVTPYQLDRALALFIQSGWYFDDGGVGEHNAADSTAAHQRAQRAGGSASADDPFAYNHAAMADASWHASTGSVATSGGASAHSPGGEPCDSVEDTAADGSTGTARAATRRKEVITWEPTSRARCRRAGRNMARLQGPRPGESCWRNRFTHEVSSEPPWTHRAVLAIGRDSGHRKASAWHWMPYKWQVEHGVPAKTQAACVLPCCTRLALFICIAMCNVMSRLSSTVRVAACMAHGNCVALWAPMHKSCIRNSVRSNVLTSATWYSRESLLTLLLHAEYGKHALLARLLHRLGARPVAKLLRRTMVPTNAATAGPNVPVAKDQPTMMQHIEKCQKLFMLPHDVMPTERQLLSAGCTPIVVQIRKQGGVTQVLCRPRRCRGLQRLCCMAFALMVRGRRFVDWTIRASVQLPCVLQTGPRACLEGLQCCVSHHVTGMACSLHQLATPPTQRCSLQVAADLGLVLARHTRVMQYIGVVNMIREYHAAAGTPPEGCTTLPRLGVLRKHCSSLYGRIRHLDKSARLLLERMLLDPAFVPSASSVLTRQGQRYYRAAAAPPLPGAPAAPSAPPTLGDVFRRVKSLYERALVPVAARGAPPSQWLLEQYGEEQLQDDIEHVGTQALAELLHDAYGPPPAEPLPPVLMHFDPDAWRGDAVPRSEGGTTATQADARVRSAHGCTRLLDSSAAVPRGRAIQGMVAKACTCHRSTGGAERCTHRPCHVARHSAFVQLPRMQAAFLFPEATLRARRVQQSSRSRQVGYRHQSVLAQCHTRCASLR